MCAKHSTPLRAITQISRLIGLYDKRLWFNFLIYLEGELFPLWVSCKSHKTSQAWTSRNLFLELHGTIKMPILQLLLRAAPPKKICLRLVEVWHKWAHSSLPKMTPFLSFILFFFLNQATQKIIRLEQNLISRFQNCLGNCQRGHTSVGATTKASVTARAR